MKSVTRHFKNHSISSCATHSTDPCGVVGDYEENAGIDINESDSPGANDTQSNEIENIQECLNHSHFQENFDNENLKIIGADLNGEVVDLSDQDENFRYQDFQGIAGIDEFGNEENDDEYDNEIEIVENEYQDYVEYKRSSFFGDDSDGENEGEFDDFGFEMNGTHECGDSDYSMPLDCI